MRTIDLLRSDIATVAGGGYAPTLDADEAALLLEHLEPPRPPAFEGWADIELMGHRSRIAYLRELELAHRGFLQLTWTDANDVEHCEIYSPAAVFSITPLDNQAVADDLRTAREAQTW